MQAISKYLSHGWPNEVHIVEALVHPYYKIQNELSEYKGLILKGSRIVISPTRMKQKLHIGHLGIERTKSKARGTMYWPNINTDIENIVANCTECQIYCNKLKKRLYCNTLSLKIHGQKWQMICFIVLMRITLFL